MDTENLLPKIASNLRELRKFQKISQKRLAEGICTQSYISMIEKGEISPSATILHAFAIRLGVDINYFFDVQENLMYQYQDELIKLIKEARDKNDYTEIRQLLKKQEQNPFMSSTKMQKFMNYHKGLCCYFLDHDAKEAIEILNQTLSTDEHTQGLYHSEDIEALVAIASIHTEEKKWPEAKPYFLQAFDIVKRYQAAIKIQTVQKVYYNYIRLLYLSGSYTEIIQVADKGINLCKENDSLYLHGQLLYYKALTLNKLERFDEAITFFEKAIMVFSVQENQQLVDYTRKIITKFKDIEKSNR
ncbi:MULTISPECIES: helix-turn-helix domain-containing protein [Bacillaceae]|uniref:helix-turn-helix domain-containing protein n=1 Tax=Bacillaceae TaxID=186817 RepID=UPI001BDF2BA8|nr:MULTISPECIES: helix-turn-helix domain-containing protein [Bacillaceae]MDX8360965.1 helix-turn-helix domain-containing protein [Cytobacillus sp. IB215316]